MNYAQYMRKVQAGQSRVIAYQNGQDASLVTLKAQARAATVKSVPQTFQDNGQLALGVATNFSKAGGGVANTLQPLQSGGALQDSARTSGGVVGVSGVGPGTVAESGSASLIAAAQNGAICADVDKPYQTVIPCGIWIDPPQNAPGVMRCCTKDMSKVFTNNSELVANQGRQLSLRTGYGLPNKLEGLRGAVAAQQ